MKNNYRNWRKNLRAFFFPKPNRNFFLRLLAVAIITYSIGRYICQPAWTNGGSMLPTYQERQFLLCWRPAFWFSAPKHGDVVVIRLAGAKIMFLKRVVALAGERVEFRNGTLLINGEAAAEPWATATSCDWNLPERTVAEASVYVVGDNRSMPMQNHEFGQVAIRRIEGKPINLF